MVDINFADWDQPLEEVSPYITMSDRLVLYPNSKVSTTVWDMEDGKILGFLEGHTHRVVDAEVNSVGGMAVTIAGGPGDVAPSSIKIWSLGTMQCTADLSSTDYTSTLLQDRLLLGSADGTIKVWDIGGSTPVALMDLQGHGHDLYSISSSDTSNTALSAYADRSLRLWDLRTGQCVRVMEGQIDTVLSISMDSACRKAVSGSMDRLVKLWDLGSGQCIQTYDFESHAHTVMMNESGSSFLAATGDVYFHAFSTSFEYTDPIFSDVDLGSMCDSTNHYPPVVASKDLSRIGMCCLKSGENRLLGMSVWK